MSLVIIATLVVLAVCAALYVDRFTTEKTTDLLLAGNTPPDDVALETAAGVVPVLGSNKSAPGSNKPALDEGWSALHRGVEYTVEVHADGAVSISFPIAEGLANPMEVDVRHGGESPVSEMSRGLDIRTLLSMGAHYIDIGQRKQHVLVELRLGAPALDREGVERILSHMLRLRDLSSD